MNDGVQRIERVGAQIMIEIVARGPFWSRITPGLLKKRPAMRSDPAVQIGFGTPWKIIQRPVLTNSLHHRHIHYLDC